MIKSVTNILMEFHWHIGWHVNNHAISLIVRRASNTDKIENCLVSLQYKRFLILTSLWHSRGLIFHWENHQNVYFKVSNNFGKACQAKLLSACHFLDQNDSCPAGKIFDQLQSLQTLLLGKQILIQWRWQTKLSGKLSW